MSYDFFTIFVLIPIHLISAQRNVRNQDSIRVQEVFNRTRLDDIDRPFVIYTGFVNRNRSRAWK